MFEIQLIVQYADQCKVCELHVQQLGTVPIHLLSADWWLNLFLSVFAYIHYYITTLLRVFALLQEIKIWSWEWLWLVFPDEGLGIQCTYMQIRCDLPGPPYFFFPLQGTKNMKRLWVMTLNFWALLLSRLFSSTVVSCKYAPPFATLALVQNGGGGGAYTQDATISLAITPSLPV